MNIFEVTKTLLFISSKLINFNEKCFFFAINNTCNCRCRMCSIWKIKNKKIVKFKDAKKALDIMYQNNFGAVQLTGGEPFLNPDIFKIISYAKKLGFIILIASNGTLITKDAADKLAKNKVEQVSISFHHYNPKIFEKIEGHKDILPKVLESIENLKEKKVPVSALCTISKYNINDIEKIVTFVEKLGIAVGFSIPIMKTDTSYSLGGDCANIKRSGLKNVINRIIKLKKDGHLIANNMTYLRDIVSSLDGKSKYRCYGGSKLFYLDWNLDLYPCMLKGKGIKINKASFNNEETCDKCLIQCFREPSLFLKSRRKTIKLLLKDSPYYFNMFKNLAKLFLSKLKNSVN